MQHFLRINQDILVNGHYLAFNRHVEAGDQITMNFSEVSVKVQDYELDERQSFSVLYEDDDLLVVNKPAGIKTHPNGPGENFTLMNQVAAYLAKQDKKAYMVHRIDQATSGVLLIGKTPIVIGILNRQLSQKKQCRANTSLLLTIRNKHSWNMQRLTSQLVSIHTISANARLITSQVYPQ